MGFVICPMAHHREDGEGLLDEFLNVSVAAPTIHILISGTAPTSLYPFRQL